MKIVQKLSINIWTQHQIVIIFTCIKKDNNNDESQK